MCTVNHRASASNYQLLVVYIMDFPLFASTNSQGASSTGLASNLSYHELESPVTGFTMSFNIAHT